MEKSKNNFTERVRSIVRSIPKGETLSYGQVAAAAGSAGAARAVGSIMKNNYDKSIPCHRVIKADGSVGEYNRGGSETKKKLLEAELHG
jgi:methylated-DNA-[protein]-cysteine S-methyltransferase